MKKITFILSIVSFCQVSYGQIEIEDKSEAPEIKATPYNGEFMSFDGVYEQEKKAGVVGQLVTLIDVSTYNVFANEDDLKSRKSVSYELKDLFKNKTFVITSYKDDVFDVLNIKNDSASYIWKISGTDKYVFNKYIDKLKEQYEGKTFIALHNKSEFEAMDGSKFNIVGDEKYKVTKVKFAKLQYDYGIIFEINNSFECIFPNKNSWDQQTAFNGEFYTTNKDYIKITSTNIFISPITLIEENEFVTFSSKNKTYLTKIRDREVQIGMNEKQCRWAWGMPSDSMKNVAGYDEVLIFGTPGNSQNLYFKGNILKLIK